MVEGQACDRIQEGTGFVVGENLIVTNAHVVAGENRTHVVTSDGRRLDTTVVAFDPNRDLAVLRVPGLGLPALDRGRRPRRRPRRALRSPRWRCRCARRRCASPSRSSPAAPTSTAPRRPSASVFVLAAVTAPGDSGAPVVDAEGRVSA